VKTTRTQTLLAAALFAALAFATSSSAAQESGNTNAVTAEKPTAGDSLSQAASDPTASLMSVQIADWYTAGFHGLSDEAANTAVLRSAIPFTTGDLKHIFRVTVPFITDHPSLDAGLSDITLFDLVVFDQSWGRWGAGAVALLPTGGSSRGAEQWALGPAVGFTSKNGKLLWGAFNQNLFTYAGDDGRTPVNASILQPIVNYGLGHGWSVGGSEMTFTYDWETSRWSNVPLGVGVSKLQRFGKLPVQFNLQYEHNFADRRGDAADTIRFSLKFLFPTH
jgi:hypothetical protein